MHTFNQELKKHVGQYNVNMSNDDLRLNQLSYEVKNFDWRLDKQIKEMEDQLSSMQSLQKVHY